VTGPDDVNGAEEWKSQEQLDVIAGIRPPDFRVARHGTFTLLTALHSRARRHLFDVSDPDFLRAVRHWQWPDASTVIVYPDDVRVLIRRLEADGFAVLEVSG
jgi:hypothetical protein